MAWDWRIALLRFHARWCGPEAIVYLRIGTVVFWVVALWVALWSAAHAGA